MDRSLKEKQGSTHRVLVRGIGSLGGGVSAVNKQTESLRLKARKTVEPGVPHVSSASNIHVNVHNYGSEQRKKGKSSGTSSHISSMTLLNSIGKSRRRARGSRRAGEYVKKKKSERGVNVSQRAFHRKGSEFETVQEHVGDKGNLMAQTFGAATARKKNLGVPQKKAVTLEKVRGGE